MKKNLIKAVLLLNVTSMALAVAPKARGWNPTGDKQISFQNDYLKVRAASKLCSAIFIRVKSGVVDPVLIKVQRFRKDDIPVETRNSGFTMSPGRRRQPGEKQLVSTDWAGPFAQSHYRITCYQEDGKPRKCQNLIDWQYKNKNRGCVAGFAGFHPFCMNGVTALKRDKKVCPVQ